MTFDERRKRKWAKGRAERGLENDAPFDGDAAAELQAEMLDAANYADQLLAEGDIGEPEADRLHAMAFDIYLFMEAVRNRRAERLRSQAA